MVGAGQAGLAIGYFLARQGRDFTILDAAPEPAAAWRARWDSLRLFTPVRWDSLPGLRFPGRPDAYPGRDDVVEYLTDYARHFDLPVELDSPVRSVRRVDRGYAVEGDDRVYAADQVVVATGPFQVPRTPPIAAQLDPGVFQIHSAAYRAPEQLPDGPVLVVGGGNTGYQIAAELARTREVHLAIGSRQTPLPQRILGVDVFRVLEAMGVLRVTVRSRLGARLSRRETLIGSSPARIREQGVVLHERAVDAAGSTIRFADDSLLDVRSVLWATGFGIDYSWIDVPVFDAHGRPRHWRGATPSSGLYFLGMSWQNTRGSALLGWVKHDAAYLADRIAELDTGVAARSAARVVPIGPTVAASH